MAVFERKCIKCNGTGIFPGHRGPDTCWPCYGTGKMTVITGDDKKRRDHVRDLGSRLYTLIDARCDELMANETFAAAGPNGRHTGSYVMAQFGKVKANEPERLDRMAASIEAGRMDDVIRALLAY